MKCELPLLFGRGETVTRRNHTRTSTIVGTRVEIPFRSYSFISLVSLSVSTLYTSPLYLRDEEPSFTGTSIKMGDKVQEPITQCIQLFQGRTQKVNKLTIITPYL